MGSRCSRSRRASTSRVSGWCQSRGARAGLYAPVRTARARKVMWSSSCPRTMKRGRSKRRSKALREQVDDDASIHAIADNCSDQTSSIVREFAAHSSCLVELWERSNPKKKAKGYALEWALPRIFAWCESRGHPAAFVCIVDADVGFTVGSLAVARAAFASGHDVLQSQYIFDQGLGLKAEVMRLASAALAVRGLGRSALGLSDTLKGNVMWFRREVLD